MEVAWSIPFLNKTQAIANAANSGHKLISIKDMKTGAKHNKRYYKDEFDVVEKIVLWKRNTENEQALGRPRFLFHDVDFFVVTKDDMTRYGIFQGDYDNLPKLKEYKYGDIIQQFKVNSQMLPVAKSIDRMLEESNFFSKNQIVNLVEKYALPFESINRGKKETKRRAENAINDAIHIYLNMCYPNRWYKGRKKRSWWYGVTEGNISDYLKKNYPGKWKRSKWERKSAYSTEKGKKEKVISFNCYEIKGQFKC